MYLSLHSTYGNGTLRTSILHIAIAGIALGACDLEYQSMSSETNSVGVSEIETKGTTSVSDPAWSPDGRMIAYAASKPYIEALRLDLSNADIAREAAIQGLPGQPYPNLYSFSPDGKKLLYTAADDNIWMADLVSRTSKIFLAEKQLSQFAWSQNGQWIAYRKAGRIWLIKSSGDENHRLRGTLHADSQPAPSPDGSTVAFIGQRGTRCNRHQPQRRARLPTSPTLE